MTSSTSLLYRLVYSTKLCLLTTLLLILSFFSQGVFVVYANVPTDEASAPIVESLPQELGNQTEQPLNEVVIEPLLEGDFAVTSESLISEESVESEDEALPDSDLIALSETSTSTNSATTTDSEFQFEEGDVDDEDNIMLDGEEDELSEPEEVDDSTTTSDPVDDDVISVNYSDTAITFNKNECTQLASGSYYCIEPHDIGLEDSLFSAPDTDGDLEIFLVRNGNQTQVTSNLVDDAAPFFDSNSNTLVWHRLIEDRYQIVSYDIDTTKEEVLTDNSTNDMEPTRQGKYTVWQRWIDNNWEIVLLTGSNEQIISNSSAHDMAPYIHGSLVVWNRFTASGEKTIEMYDIGSQTYVTVDDPEGLSVTNPRMVFVYDSMHPNGDIVTKGYDLISRQFINLDTLPRKLPEEIPESDSTGETRALIQSKPSVKGESVKNVEETGPEPLPALDDTINSSTSTVPTLDMRSASSSETIVATSTVQETIEDVVDNEIEPLYIPALNPDIDANTVQE